MSEGELLRLAADADSLTENARGALGEELSRRRLGREEIERWKAESGVSPESKDDKQN